MEVVNITFNEFNSMRQVRGADPAEFVIHYDDEEWDYLWMSKRDIINNISLFPEHNNELNKGLDCFNPPLRDYDFTKALKGDSDNG